mmetsp:Transcript_30780/g.46686  ORF Transcript_30780/g.46686 Transcript_30780/m.46686 type:complete len:103 (+) Transcript_30780:36-344(+)
MSASSFLTFTGVLLILHSAISCLHFRGLVADLNDVAETIPTPLDVQIEVLLGFILCLVGQISGVGPLRNIKTSASVTAPIYITREFDTYRHRGTALRTTVTR